MFGLWKIKSKMCLCNQVYTRSSWRGGDKNTQHQSGEAVAIILASTLACKEILSRWSSMCSYGISVVPCKRTSYTGGFRTTHRHWLALMQGVR
ncbi:hypothetical protein QL285_071919 [Trifolium repens]|nr:hypothetical protein QL285_071919 [Trifolium repens]